MFLRVDPKIDYAFKRVFGDQRNDEILIHLLNAILQPELPIESVEILNPFSEKDFAEDKLTVLDVRARDETGRVTNVEMQLLLPAHFKARILYYWADMFRQQLRQGDSYAKLRPAVSICLVNQDLFPDAPAYHLVFELVDKKHSARFTDLMQMHVLQLPKFTCRPEELRTDLEIWLYLFRHPESIDLDNLPERMNQPIFLQAIKELTMLTQDEQERMRYEARVKAIRDQQSLLEDAEERGIEKGEFVGRIHAYERLLHRPLTPSDDLVQLSLDDLRRRADELEAELTSGGSNNSA